MEQPTESNPRQFVVVSFKPDDKRTYTYHWDGEPFAIGDDAKAPDNRSSDWKRVKVVDVHDVKPSFPTKAIVGKILPIPADKVDLVGRLETVRDIFVPGHANERAIGEAIDELSMPEADPSNPSALWATGDRDQ